jgi:rhamnose utilization protein RhaD (predicted bifunctional aldolase and dehydrogenase)
MTDLLTVSHRYGRDPAFVLAGGGNTSLKTADRLWVKASGTALATITEAGFVEMDRAKLQRILDDGWPEDPAVREAEFQRRISDARVRPELNQRPSVEVLLHHLMPQRLVVHTHPTVVNAVTCCVYGSGIAAAESGVRFVWQPYVDPGWVLGNCVAGSVSATLENLGWQASVVLLENHGLVVAGDSVDEIERTTNTIIAGFPPLPKPFTAAADRGQLAGWEQAIKAESVRSTGVPPVPCDPGTGETPVLRGTSIVSDSSAPIRWITDTAEGKAAALAGPMTPDQIVYARSFPLWLDGPPSADGFRPAVARYVERYGFEPWVILVAGAGMIVIRSTPKMAEITRAVYTDAAVIYRAAHGLGGVQTLSAGDRDFIESWEVESYRRTVSQKEK